MTTALRPPCSSTGDHPRRAEEELHRPPSPQEHSAKDFPKEPPAERGRSGSSEPPPRPSLAAAAADAPTPATSLTRPRQPSPRPGGGGRGGRGEARGKGCRGRRRSKSTSGRRSATPGHGTRRHFLLVLLARPPSAALAHAPVRSQPHACRGRVLRWGQGASKAFSDTLTFRFRTSTCFFSHLAGPARSSGLSRPSRVALGRTKHSHLNLSTTLLSGDAGYHNGEVKKLKYGIVSSPAGRSSSETLLPSGAAREHYGSKANPHEYFLQEDFFSIWDKMPSNRNAQLMYIMEMYKFLLFVSAFCGIFVRLIKGDSGASA